MRIILIFLLILVPTIALAAPDFVPIVGIPLSDGGQLGAETSLGEYVNAIFKLAIFIGATLAVLQIMYGGFEYMFSEAAEKKAGGKERITQALYGLILLLMVWLILSIINKDILDLRALL